ncbi:MAG: response regulator [Terriglobales bacterium]
MPLKILLADDNITAQRTGAKILTDAGHTVVAVSNGAAAVKKFASEKPELLILDVYMPGYSGLEVCDKVKSAPETAGVPVLLTITPMEPFSLEDGNRVKADGVLTKPFEAIAVDLVAVVAKFEQKLHPAAAPEPLSTQRIEAPEFEDASYAEWKEAAGEGEPAKPVAMSAEVAAAPALGIDELSVEPAPAPFAMDIPAVEPPPEPSAAPSASVFGLDQAAAAPAFDVASPAPTTEFDLSSPAAPSEEAPAPMFDLSETAAPAPQAAPAVAEGVEFTSAPQVGEIAVAAAPELEVTAQAAAGEVVIQQESGLVTNADDMSQFATKFGVEHPDDVPVGVAMEIPPTEAPADEEEDVLEIPVAELAPAQVATEPPTYEPTQRIEASPEPYPTTQRLEAPPEPAPEAEAEMRGAFSAGAGGAAAAPALESPSQAEPEPEAAAAEVDPANLTQKLVAQFAEELERAQIEAEPAAEPAPEPAAEAAPPSEEQRITEVVSRVLDQHKTELIAAIVRELKG